jgi:hypothetical protein
VGQERDSLSLVSAIVQILERKSSGSGLENRDYGRIRKCWQLTSSTSGGGSVGIARSQTKATELLLLLLGTECLNTLVADYSLRQMAKEGSFRDLFKLL